MHQFSAEQSAVISSHKQSENQSSPGSGHAESQPSSRTGHPKPQLGSSDRRIEPGPSESGKPHPANRETLRIGIVSISDRASNGVYEDRGLPALRAWLEAAIVTAFQIEIGRAHV